MEEIWKDIKFTDNGKDYDYTGYYQISNFGNIKSLARYTHPDKKGNRMWKKEKLLDTKNTDGKRATVNLRKDGKPTTFYVYRLVALHFIPNPENKPEVDHIIPVRDGGTNHVDNLRWVTTKENVNNPRTKEFVSRQKKGKKLSDYAYEQSYKAICKGEVIGTSIKDGSTICFKSAEEAKRNGYQINGCLRGERKAAYGYTWRYVNDERDDVDEE